MVGIQTVYRSCHEGWELDFSHGGLRGRRRMRFLCVLCCFASLRIMNGVIRQQILTKLWQLSMVAFSLTL
jgi:hypothetical protein